MPVKFCTKCQNMLYPKEDVLLRRRTGKKFLLYACRSCDEAVRIEDPVEPVYRNVVHHTAEEKLVITHDVVSDPTLPRTYNVKCPNCEGREAVYYQSPVGKNDEALILVFTCVACRRRWLSGEED